MLIEYGVRSSAPVPDVDLWQTDPEPGTEGGR